jgi:hypothetical protein
VLADQELLARFHCGKTLPANYGVRIDERVVEYTWFISKLAISQHSFWDVGSALNQGYVLDHPALRNRKIVIYNLSPENFSGAIISHTFLAT